VVRSRRSSCQSAQRTEDDVRSEEGRRLPRQLRLLVAARALHDEDAAAQRVRRYAHLHARRNAHHDLCQIKHPDHDRLVGAGMRMKRTALLIASLTALTTYAADTPDLTMQTRIRQEGFRNSKVMETASGLMDQIGARLTGSPNMKRANDWTL